MYYYRRLSNGSRHRGTRRKGQNSKPRLGPHRPLKSMRSQTGDEGGPAGGFKPQDSAAPQPGASGLRRETDHKHENNYGHLF